MRLMLLVVIRIQGAIIWSMLLIGMRVKVKACGMLSLPGTHVWSTALLPAGHTQILSMHDVPV